MKKRNFQTLDLTAMLLVVAFTVLNFFTCVECCTEYIISHIGDVEQLVDIETKRGDVFAVPVLGTLQMIFIALRRRKFAIASMVCACLAALIPGIFFFKCYCETLLGSFGGLVMTTVKITAVGYAVILIGIANLIVQIISVRKKKEGNVQ